MKLKNNANDNAADNNNKLNNDILNKNYILRRSKHLPNGGLN